MITCDLAMYYIRSSTFNVLAIFSFHVDIAFCYFRRFSACFSYVVFQWFIVFRGGGELSSYKFLVLSAVINTLGRLFIFVISPFSFSSLARSGSVVR